MIRFLHIVLTVFYLVVLSVGNTAAEPDEITFEINNFRELATRAEDVVSNDQASTQSLEKLRSDLVSFRSQALSEQELRARRVETIQEQISALGASPIEGQQESELVALRRQELNGQLAEARAPLIVSQEAYRRSDGLIHEIDGIIRSRQATRLLQLDKSPLNPASWAGAAEAIGQYSNEIKSEITTQWNNEVSSEIRRQNGPIILIVIIIGLLLMFPMTRWAGRGLIRTSAKRERRLRDVKHLISSLAVFILPIVGLIFILAALSMSEIFSVKGDLLIMRSIPLMGLSIFGANWLARHLPKGQFVTGNDSTTNAMLIGGQRTVTAMGFILALFFLVAGMALGAKWSSDVISVLRFPFIVLLGYSLFRIGRKINLYNQTLLTQDGQSGIKNRIATLLMWACYVSGIGGPILSVLGYSNAGTTLVISMVLSLALMAALFFIYILLVRFVETNNFAINSEAPAETANGLYKVALAFALICVGAPGLALLWGARLSDISGLWFTLKEGISLGETRISISDFLVFVVIFFIGYTITRLMQTALRTAVLPNTRLDSGAQNALVTGFGYLGIFIAALVAIMSTGLDLSNLAIVAGALSVGIGFGLQAIVSNFVSGIILLIERPVKIGDWVEVGTHSGYVKDISVRSTSIETFDRATVIVPNADLIAGTVTNWTHDNLRGRVKVPIGVAYGTDPELVKNILLEIADNHPNPLKNPEPWVIFKGFGADALEFELRAIIRDVNDVLETHSDMNYEIARRFRDEGIEIPFAQREVTIKNAQDFVLKKPKINKTTRSKQS